MSLVSDIVSVAAGIITLVGAAKLVYTPVRKLIKDNEERDRKLSETLEKVARKVDMVEKKTDDNERDRIRREIFVYGNRARKGEDISNEEFRSLQMDFEKYSTILGGNGIAHDEYELVKTYYNKRSGL